MQEIKTWWRKKERAFSWQQIFLLLPTFLAAWNYQNKLYYLIFLLCGFALVFSWKNRIDASSVCLLFLGFAFYLFVPETKESLTNLIKPFLYVLAYLAGRNLVAERKKKSPLLTEDRLETHRRVGGRWIAFALVIALGLVFHLLLNMLINKGNDDRNTVDFWVNGVLSATLQASLGVLPIGVIVAILFSNCDVFAKLCAVVAAVIVVSYGMILAGRTLILLFVIAGGAACLHFLVFDKGWKKKLLVMLPYIVLIWLGFAAYYGNWWGLQDKIQDTNFFKRYFINGVIDFSEDPRMDFKKDFLKNFSLGLYGGGKIYAKLDFYAHDLLLDTYDLAGILALVSLGLYICFALFRAARCLVAFRLDFKVRQFVLCAYLVCFVEFLLEPILLGMPWLFIFFCFLDGMTATLLEKDKRLRLVDKYRFDPIFNRPNGVVQINTVYKTGSTGKIAYQIQRLCENEGIPCLVACRYGKKEEEKDGAVFVSGWWDNHIHNRLAGITGLQGCFSSIRTRLFLRKLDKLSPKIIHLHNIHANYINLRLLFAYIKERGIRVVWTLHDCWAFTGYCAYFDLLGCEKWKTGCQKCPKRKEEKRFLDASSRMYKKKKEYFSGVDSLTFVTPSKWLAGLVKQSYLQDYPVQVINNGIDLNIFKPTKSDFRAKHGIKDEFVLLGVAFGWERRKGLDVFIELSKRLNRRFKIVLVGTSESTDKQLPENIISIHRTQNQTELAEIYSAADLFVNPTREENFPTVNIESIACGTPVVTFHTGGSGETLNEKCGVVVEKDDIDAMQKEIERIERERLMRSEDCVARAHDFDMHDKFKEYIDLYKENLQ